MEIIKELKRNTDKTIITITHDLELANQSDYIFVFNKGKVSAEGSPEEIFEMEEVLNDSNLEVPFELKLYHEVLNDKNLKNDGKLVDALCQLSSKK